MINATSMNAIPGTMCPMSSSLFFNFWAVVGIFIIFLSQRFVFVKQPKIKMKHVQALLETLVDSPIVTVNENVRQETLDLTKDGKHMAMLTFRVTNSPLSDKIRVRFTHKQLQYVDHSLDSRSIRVYADLVEKMVMQLYQRIYPKKESLVVNGVSVVDSSIQIDMPTAIRSIVIASLPQVSRQQSKGTATNFIPWYYVRTLNWDGSLKTLRYACMIPFSNQNCPLILEELYYLVPKEIKLVQCPNLMLFLTAWHQFNNPFGETLRNSRLDIINEPLFVKLENAADDDSEDFKLVNKIKEMVLSLNGPVARLEFLRRAGVIFQDHDGNQMVIDLIHVLDTLVDEPRIVGDWTAETIQDDDEEDEDEEEDEVGGDDVYDEDTDDVDDAEDDDDDDDAAQD